MLKEAVVFVYLGGLGDKVPQRKGQRPFGATPPLKPPIERAFKAYGLIPQSNRDLF